MDSMPETSVKIDSSRIASVLEENLARYSIELGLDETGHVLEVGDGVALIDGLPGVMSEEMVQFSDDVFGMVMNLERNRVGAIILGDCSRVQQGDLVRRSGKVLQVPVGEALLGRIVNPLGLPIDGKGAITTQDARLVEIEGPGIVAREPVEKPLQTGLKSIDAMTAIGRGQRELIIGDRQTGKTTLAIDAILNQKHGDVICIYVAIGQKMSNVAGITALLQDRGALGNCIVVAASAADSAPMQYIAPFAACAMAEYFRDRGDDVLIVYDDMLKHAVAYREISLVLRRPPGREAFPGDIFYLHSRLLERAAKLSQELGGGSLTALPIVETQEGEYSAYIPTNLISMTDGQIYLESDLFRYGFRPAVNVGLSVSRVGGDAQLPAMKKTAGMLRLDFAQYREIESFVRLATEVDAVTRQQLRRGERIAELLKQPAHEPMPVEHEIMILWAVTGGLLDDLPVSEVSRFEKQWLSFMDGTCPHVGAELAAKGELTAQLEQELRQTVDTFRKMFLATLVNAGAATDQVSGTESR
jgi:F-type H+-transporting ATPase subunit alpha